MSGGDLIGLGIGIALFLGTAFIVVTWAKTKVRADLERRGLQLIKIRFTPGLPFYVEYRTPDGLVHENTCVVQSSIYSDKATIHWEKPLQ